MTTPGIQWTPGEAATLNEFLNSPVGRKWIEILVTRRPMLDLTTVERAAISAAYSSGFDRIFSEIAATRIALQEPESASIKSIDPAKD